MSENRAANFFWHLQDIYHELKPCRFAFIVAIIGAIVFLEVEQGREVLRALAEPGARTGVTGALRLVMFGTGLAIWSLTSWYSARVLLYFDFPTSHETQPQHRNLGPPAFLAAEKRPQNSRCGTNGDCW